MDAAGIAEHVENHDDATVDTAVSKPCITMDSEESGEIGIVSVSSPHLPDASTIPGEPITAIRAESQFYELCGHWETYRKSRDNFLRGCRWGSNGLLFALSNDNVLNAFNPNVFVLNEDGRAEMTSVRSFKECELLYDFAVTIPGTNNCYVATAARDHPVHVWDGDTSQLVCSLSCYNSGDQVAAPHSLSFDHDGSMLFCGLKRTIVRYPMNIGASGAVTYRLSTRANKGIDIVSSISVAYGCQGSQLACGSFNRHVAYIDLRVPRDPAILYHSEMDGGVTQVLLSPQNFYLFAGGRKDDTISCWDLRNFTTPCYKYRRRVHTNQRVLFDLTPDTQCLCSGGTDGLVRIWDLRMVAAEDGYVDPMLMFRVTNDAVNAVQVHPETWVLAVTTGQRCFDLRAFIKQDDSENEELIDDDPLVSGELARDYFVGLYTFT